MGLRQKGTGMNAPVGHGVAVAIDRGADQLDVSFVEVGDDLACSLSVKAQDARGREWDGRACLAAGEAADGDDHAVYSFSGLLGVCKRISGGAGGNGYLLGAVVAK